MPFGPSSFSLVLRAASHVLLCSFESCLDSLVPAIGLSGTLMSICAYVLHAVCLGILLVVELGLGAHYWPALSVACMFWSVKNLACLYLAAFTCLNA